MVVAEIDFGFGLLAALGAVGFGAGMVDAIAGGGGLLTMPTLLATGLPPHLALGTNKGQSVCGAASALMRFSRSPLLDRRRALLGFMTGLIGSIVGVMLVQMVPGSALRPLVIMLLLAAVVALVGAPKPGLVAPRDRSRWMTAAVGGGLGAYDGFFGPGTGSFLIIANTRWWGERADVASANAKVVNCASNVGALLAFMAIGQVVWLPALVMGAGQMLGGWGGAHLVVRRGAGLVRWFAIAVCLGLILKLSVDLLRNW